MVRCTACFQAGSMLRALEETLNLKSSFSLLLNPGFIGKGLHHKLKGVRWYGSHGVHGLHSDTTGPTNALSRIALIGRPNVGKSTLFNKLTGRRAALVHDTPGSHVTRDYKEGIASLSDLNFMAIDTSGLEPFVPSTTIQGRATDITLTMLKGTTAALFMIDGRAGVATQDYDVAKWLRKVYKQPVILVCSKVDHTDNMQIMANVHEATCLGLGEALPLSAESNAGMVDLYDALRPIVDAHNYQPPEQTPLLDSTPPSLPTIPPRPKKSQSFGGWDAPRSHPPPPSSPAHPLATQTTPVDTIEDPWTKHANEMQQITDAAISKSNERRHRNQDADEGEVAVPEEKSDLGAVSVDRPIKLALMGLPNVGKSTMLNQLLGYERSLTGPEAALTRDAITANFEWRGFNFELSDTAGWLRRGNLKTYDDVGGRVTGLTVLQGKAKMNYSHAVVLLINSVDANTRLEAARFDSVQMMNRREMDLAGSILDEGRILVVAMNKMDQLSADQRRKVMAALKTQIDTSLASWSDCIAVAPVAALSGKGVDRIMQTVVDLHSKWSRTIPTSVLNNWRYKMSMAYEGHGRSPLSSLKFIKMISARPPTFLAHFRGKVVSANFPRSIAKALRRSFGLEGVPVRVIPMTKARRGEQEKRLAIVAKKALSAGTKRPRPGLEAVIRKPINRRPPALSI